MYIYLNSNKNHACFFHDYLFFISKIKTCHFLKNFKAEMMLNIGLTMNNKMHATGVITFWVRNLES